MKIEALYLTALFYIAWMYCQKSDAVAYKLFLKLPLGLRNQVYWLIYQKLEPVLSARRKSDQEFGKKTFHRCVGYPDIPLAIRLQAISQVGSQRVEKLSSSILTGTMEKGIKREVGQATF